MTIDSRDLATIETAIEKTESSIKEIRVVDPESYQLSSVILIETKRRRKLIDEIFEPALSSAYKAHHELSALKRKFTDRLDRAENIFKLKLSAYRVEERKRTEEAERELAVQLKKEDEERRLTFAIEMEAAGKGEEANAILDDPTPPPAVVLAPEIPKVSGISARKIWKYRVENQKLIPFEFLMVDEKKLGEYARAMKETARVPGVSFYWAESVSVATGFATNNH